MCYLKIKSARKKPWNMHQSVRSFLNFQNQTEFNILDLKNPILLADAKL